MATFRRGTTVCLMQKRLASAQAQPKSSSKSQSLPAAEPVKVQKTQRGIKVASLENHAPVTRVAAVFSAGARDEQYNELGMIHALRAHSNLATRNFSMYGMTRRLDHLGINLSVIGGREYIVYLAETHRNNLRFAVDAIAEITTKPLFRQWELSDAQAKIELDLEFYKQSPEIRIGELLHKAAFKNGLNNSVYAPKFNLGNVTCENTVKRFHDAHVNTGRMVLVGTGVGHDELAKFANEFTVTDKPVQQREKAVYTGGEVLKRNTDDTVHAAIGFEGVARLSQEMLASTVLQHVLGAGPRVKTSAGAGRIQRSTLSGASHPAVISTFNLPYSDTGLFGFQIIADKSDVNNIARGVFREVSKLGKNGVSSAELENAKNAAKGCVAAFLDCPINQIKIIGAVPDHANEYVNSANISKAIDAVTADQVNAAAKRLASSKPSLAAIGNLSNLSRLVDLQAAN